MGTKKPKSLKQPINRSKDKPLPKTVAAGLTDKDDSKPTISFLFADRSYIGSWQWATGQETGELLDFLCDMSNSTWSEIRNQQTGTRDRHRKHHEQDFESLCAAAQDRIRDRHLDEIFEDVFRFRMSGEKRLWGFVRNGVFYILWWDPGHQVYPLERG